MKKKRGGGGGGGGGGGAGWAGRGYIIMIHNNKLECLDSLVPLSFRCQKVRLDGIANSISLGRWYKISLM